MFKLKVLFYWARYLFRPALRTRKDVEAFQARQIRRFERKTLRHSEFYQRFFTAKGLDWSSIPVITKTEFMASFDQINTQKVTLEQAMDVALTAERTRDFNRDLNGLTVGLSTGTSGKRGLFLASDDERAQWVALVMSRVIRPRLFKKQKIAFFLRANSTLYSAVSSKLFEFRYFDIFQPLDGLLAQLNDYQPDILASQPSVLIDVAEAQRRAVIRIAPTQIISYAEVLTDSDRATIQACFGVGITNVYQCTEGFLGVSCSHGTMHLNEDHVRIDQEWIDEDKFVPIVTDFTRHSQPVVKYRLNDILKVKSDGCGCGSPFLAIDTIIGREDDVLVLDGKRVYPDLIARTIAIHTNEFQKYTIEQVGTNALHIGIDGEPEVFESTSALFKTVLERLFNEQGIRNTEYGFSPQISKITGGKLRKIKRSHHEA
jgi:putative adenylate-forming enzyme